MLTGNTQFESELKKRIATEVDRLVGIIAKGQAVKDFADYKYYVGQLHAFERVSQNYCDDVNSTINKQGL